MAKALEVEMSDFFGRQYSEAWKFDGDEIAKLYCVPTVTMRGDGSIHCLQSHEELARFFQGVLDTYKRQGHASTTMHDLMVVPIGDRSAALGHKRTSSPDGIAPALPPIADINGQERCVR
jgi:hypothetical protein